MIMFNPAIHQLRDVVEQFLLLLFVIPPKKELSICHLTGDKFDNF